MQSPSADEGLPRKDSVSPTREHDAHPTGEVTPVSVPTPQFTTTPPSSPPPPPGPSQSVPSPPTESPSLSQPAHAASPSEVARTNTSPSEHSPPPPLAPVPELQHDKHKEERTQARTPLTTLVQAIEHAGPQETIVDAVTQTVEPDATNQPTALTASPSAAVTTPPAPQVPMASMSPTTTSLEGEGEQQPQPDIPTTLFSPSIPPLPSVTSLQEATQNQHQQQKQTAPSNVASEQPEETLSTISPLPLPSIHLDPSSKPATPGESSFGEPGTERNGATDSGARSSQSVQEPWNLSGVNQPPPAPDEAKTHVAPPPTEENTPQRQPTTDSISPREGEKPASQRQRDEEEIDATTQPIEEEEGSASIEKSVVGLVLEELPELVDEDFTTEESIFTTLADRSTFYLSGCFLGASYNVGKL